MEEFKDLLLPTMILEQKEEYYQKCKNRILEDDPNSKVVHGLLFYIEDTKLISEKITFLKENYDFVNRSGNTLDKETVKQIILKYHV